MNLEVSVTKSFPSEFRLDASFSMQSPQLGIFGQSGSGKSTLANLLAGVERPDRGEIVLDGTTLFSSELRIDLPPEKRSIGVVFQHAHLFPHLSVRANLLYGWKRCVSGRHRIRPDEVIGVLRIENLLERGVSRLSGGERQRVALGRALLANPRLLLMDEPLSSLDDSMRFTIIPFLRNACRTFDIPYLFISHSLVEMRMMSTRVIVLENGRQIADTCSDALADIRAMETPSPERSNATPPFSHPLSAHSYRRRNGMKQRRQSCCT